MSNFSNTSPITSGTASAHGSGLRGFFSAVMREIRIRRALREVSTLDDATLQDIGLGPSHGAIEGAIRNGRDC